MLVVDLLELIRICHINSLKNVVKEFVAVALLFNEMIKCKYSILGVIS